MKRRLKTQRLAKWLAKYRLFLSRSTAKEWSISDKSTSRRVKDGKTKKKIKWYHFPTQVIRKDIVRGLGELYDLALEFGKDEALEMKEREKWSRLAAYIAQTINTIIESYDELKIEETMDELKQYVKINIEET